MVRSGSRGWVCSWNDWTVPENGRNGRISWDETAAGTGAAARIGDRPLQPEGEILLQICCRCSQMQQSIQALIVVSGSGPTFSWVLQEAGAARVGWTAGERRFYICRLLPTLAFTPL